MVVMVKDVRLYIYIMMVIIDKPSINWCRFRNHPAYHG